MTKVFCYITSPHSSLIGILTSYSILENSSVKAYLNTPKAVTGNINTGKNKYLSLWRLINNNNNNNHGSTALYELGPPLSEVTGS
jgi:hypothetical protein